MPKPVVPVVTNQNGNTPVQGNLSVWGMTGMSGDSITPAGRFVGATASGHPTVGTFAKGDFCVDPGTPGFWICTVTGTPGTWASIT